MNRPVITLTTDFGSGPFSGIMKGVILGICPEATLVDICHTVPPQDIRAGALVVEQALSVFTPGTVHLCVVDPGVGTSRKAVAVSAMGMNFIGPDNGLLSAPILSDPKAKVWSLDNRQYFREPVSATFHGRDIFAPCAAHVAMGTDPAKLGKPLADPRLLDMTKAKLTGDKIRGKIISVDSFGNLTSNIQQGALRQLGPLAELEITLHLPDEAMVIKGVNRVYGQAAPGKNLAVIDSMGRLELSVNQGSMSRRLAGRGVDPGGLTISVKRQGD